MLIPFGAPPALRTRRNAPSERIPAEALAWWEAQPRPSTPTTTSSGRLRPTPTFRRLSIGIGASTAALCGAGTTGWALREREAPPLEDQEPVRALPDDFVGDAGRELALDRLRRLAPRQHALDEELGRWPRDPTHLGGPRGPPRGWARSLEGLGLLRSLLHGGMLHRLVSDRDGFLHDTASKPQSNVRRTSAKSSAWGTSSWVLRANGWTTRVSARPCAPRSTRPRLNKYSTKRRASSVGAGAVREPRSSAAEELGVGLDEMRGDLAPVIRHDRRGGDRVDQQPAGVETHLEEVRLGR